MVEAACRSGAVAEARSSQGRRDDPSLTVSDDRGLGTGGRRLAAVTWSAVPARHVTARLAGRQQPSYGAHGDVPFWA
jgi:hypothetical protein